MIIENNNIKSDGAKMIGNSLKSNKTLVKLNLGKFVNIIESNNIKSDAAVSFIDLLNVNNTLFTLKLSI